MDRYRVAPRPVYLSAAAAATGGHDDVPRRQLPLHPHVVAAGASTRRSGGAELDIFSAERYFNADDVIKKKREDALAVVAAIPAPSSSPRQEMMAAVVVDAASQSGRTVASSSEASWNSRSGLLSSHATQSTAAVKRGGAAAAGKKPGQRWGIFSRDCPCAGRKAVTVDVASEPATPRTYARFDNSHVIADSAIFKAKSPPPPPLCEEEEPVRMKISPGNSSRAFPPPPRLAANTIFAAAAPSIGGRPVVVSSGGGGGGGFTFPVSARAAVVVDEPPRESLEVFRPIDEESVLADDPPPAEHLSGFARAAGVAAADEEAMSDASSELFDLESFAASSSYPTTTSYRGRGSRRHSREYDDEHLPYGAGAGGVEPALSECMYAPSEVSVVWSVATVEGGGAFDTASLANFSSAASACCVEEFTFVAPDSAGAGHDGFTAAMSRSAGRKKGGGFLNSCRCEKAVSVGPTPVRVVRPAVDQVNGKAGGGGGGHAMGLAGGGAARYHHGRVHMPVRT